MSPFGISPDVLAISPAQMLAAQDRRRQMAQNYQLSLMGLDLERQRLSRGGGGRTTRMPSMQERATAREQQRLERQAIDRQLHQETMAKGAMASRRFYEAPSQLQYGPQTIPLPGEGLQPGPPAGITVQPDYPMLPPTSPALTQEFLQAPTVEPRLQPETALEQARVEDIQSQIQERKIGKGFIGEPTLEQRQAGMTIGYDKEGNRILVKKKETGIEALSVSALSGIVKSPDKYTPEIVEAAKDEFYKKLGIPEDKPEDPPEEKQSKLRRILEWFRPIQREVTEELPALQQRVAPQGRIGYSPEKGRYEYGTQVEHTMPGGGTMPGPEHPGAVPGTTRPTGRIRVRNKTSGQTGTIPAGEFDPNIYERL